MKFAKQHKPRSYTTQLETLRRAAGLSQNQVAKETGLSVGTICAMERPAEREYVASDRAITVLAAYFGVDHSTIEGGQLRRLRCECCDGKGHKLEIM